MIDSSDSMTARSLIEEECDDIKRLLLDKNRKYGNSAINPLRIFSKSSPIEQINVRIDDKISRIVRGEEGTIDEDVELDMIGYFILKRVARKFYNKKELPLGFSS